MYFRLTYCIQELCSGRQGYTNPTAMQHDAQTYVRLKRGKTTCEGHEKMVAPTFAKERVIDMSAALRFEEYSPT